MRRDYRVRAAATPAISLLVFSLALMTAAQPAAGALVATFADGSTSRTVYLPGGGGTDSSVSISLSKNSYPTSATLTVRGGPDSAARYPANPAVYLSSPSNSTQIYGYSGTGYGAMGLQSAMANGSTSYTVPFGGSGSSSNTTLLLPYGSTVESGDLTLAGSAIDLGFFGPDSLNTQVGNNNLQIDTSQRGSPYLVDIDADGDLDLFAAGGNFSSFNEPYAGGPRFYRNIGNSTAWHFREESSLLRRVQQGYGFSPALADLDADGDFDLLTVGGYYNPVVRFYWNNGTSTNASWQLNGTVFSGLTVDAFVHAAFADLDADGDFDLTLGLESGALSYVRNTGSKTSPAWTSATMFSGISVGGAAAPSFGDYDADGDLDLVIGNGTTTWTNFGDGTEVIKYYENTGSATSPTWTLGTATNSMNVGGTYTGTNLAPFLADMDKDGDLDMVVADYNGLYWIYLGQRSIPKDVSLDVGNDGTTDWSWSGQFQNTTVASGLASAFQSALNVGSPPADAWGNRMVTVTLRVSTGAAGFVSLSGIRVAYNYTATSSNFATLLNRVREGSSGDALGNVVAAVPVSASSAGAVTLGGLQLQLNLPPTVVSPPVLHLNEDTRVDNLIDLSTVFFDDAVDGSGLAFNVTSNSAPSHVDVFVASGGLFLGADAQSPPQSDNWYGNVTATVRATDNYGLTATATFVIVVDAVNDLPVIGGVQMSYSILEDQGFQLTPIGMDVDLDPLSWTVAGLPSGASFEAASGTITWTPKNANVGDHTVTLALTDGLETVQATFTLTVVNVNDPPFILAIPEQTAQETIPLLLDLSPYFGDEDDTSLNLTVSAPHAKLAGTLVTFLFPKGSGVQVERVRVAVNDGHGGNATGVFIVNVIPSGPDIAISGVPDVQVVEGTPETIDLAPYLFNVEDWAAVTITTSSPQVTAESTKITLLYPVGFASDTEGVKITASEGDDTAATTITVTIVRLGQQILIADLPDIDIAADEEMVVELSPYIHNVGSWSAVVITVDSLFAEVDGTQLRLLYPASTAITAETVTVTVAESGHSVWDSMVVRVRTVGRSFYLDPIAPINLVEGQTYVLFLSTYVHNADPVSDVELFASSTHATVDGLRIQFLYPVGGGVEHEQVALMARYGTQVFQTVISVDVAAIGAAFALAGVPNVAVYADTPYTLSLEAYLYNVPGGDLGAVVVTVDSASVSVRPGPELRFLYTGASNITHDTVTITAKVGAASSSQTITVTVRPLGTRLAIAPIPDVRVNEDESITVDIGPYILNEQGALKVFAESAFVKVDSGTRLTFTYPGGIGTDEVVITVQDSSQTAQGTVRVKIVEHNDAPFAVAAPQNFSVAPGTELSWDLAALFGDEEDASALTFLASDPRVQVNNATRRATFVVPAVGTFDFTFTALDGHDDALTAVSSPVHVTGVASGGGATGPAVGAGGDFAFPLLALLVALGATLLLRKLGGVVLGAGSPGPLLSRRP